MAVPSSFSRRKKVHRDEFEALFTMEKSGESNESI